MSDCLAKSGFFPLREYAFALSMKDEKTPSPIASTSSHSTGVSSVDLVTVSVIRPLCEGHAG